MYLLVDQELSAPLNFSLTAAGWRWKERHLGSGRGRITWKDALGLELEDPGFDASVLSAIRGPA